MILPSQKTHNMVDTHLRSKWESVYVWKPPFAQKYTARSLRLCECSQTAARPNQDSSHAVSGSWLKIQCGVNFQQMVAWPSGLRRWFKAPVTKVAWVRIPPLPSFFFFFPSLLLYKGITSDFHWCVWHVKVGTVRGARTPALFPCHIANFLCMWPGNEASGTTIHSKIFYEYYYFKGVIKDLDKWFLTIIDGCGTHFSLLQHRSVVHVEFPWHRLDQPPASDWNHSKPSSKDA